MLKGKFDFAVKNSQFSLFKFNFRSFKSDYNMQNESENPTFKGIR